MKSKIISFVTAFAVMFAVFIVPASVPETYAAEYGSEQLTDYAYQVAAIVNRERAARGLNMLKYSDKLSEAAIVRAEEIQTYFSHTRPNGTSCFTAVSEKGIKYRYIGENIAYGQRNPEEVMDSWMNSDGHRANILSANVEYMGIGVTYRNGVYYWTQFFAASDNLTGEIVTFEQQPQQIETTTALTTTEPIQSATVTAAIPAEEITEIPTEVIIPEKIEIPCGIDGRMELIKLILRRFGINMDSINVMN